MTININGNTYPVFEANQVLKHTDLKGLFDYLDGHHRLTRTYLIGIGIVCGLTVEFDAESTSIQVSHGCGVTSEGYLIQLAAVASLGYYQTVDVSESLFKPTPESGGTGNGSSRNGNGNGSGSNFQTYPVLELFASEADDRLPLTQNPDGSDRSPSDIQEFIASHVVVLVCELDNIKRDSCLADCDSRGSDRNLRTRFFLLPKTGEGDPLTADKLLRQGYPFDDLGSAWAGLGTEAVLTASRDFWRDPHLRVRRFGYGEETPPNTTQAVPMVRLSAIKNFDGLLANYYEICNRAIADIASAFPRLFRIFSPFFSAFHPDTTEDFDGLEGRLTARLRAIWSPESPDPSQLEAVEAQYAMQYFYDYLSQLVAAYYELATAAFDLMDDCAPDCRRFPKFLMLGEPTFPGTAKPCPVPSAYRHHFVQPPIYNGNPQRVQQVRHLYQRLHRLCADDAFFMLPFYDTPLAITPSPDRSAPLSQQAIPYYLNYPQIYPYWNYDACRKGISDRHPAYFYPLTSGSPTTTTNLLVHRLDAYNFYRIEGHVGEERDFALREIKAYQQRYNLAFDVITLKLSPTIEALRDSELSGHFDDLEADYGRMRDKFLKLWEKHKEDWSRNVFLNTLRREFFAEPMNSDASGLLSLSEGQVVNPVLALARNPDNYEFQEQTGANGEPTGQYFLFVVDQNRNSLARFSPQRNLAPNDDLIDLSGLSPAVVTEEQQQIRETLAACFGLGKVWFETIPNPTNRLVYFVRLAIADELEIPSRGDGESQQVPMGLLWLTPFSITGPSSSAGPFIAQPEYHNFETLYRLLWGVPAGVDEPSELPFPGMDKEAAECLNYFEFKGLMEVYFNRLQRLKELHLFHNFADLHPGMEPLGGVPKGGTFVLVYVDGKDVINNLQQVEQSVRFRARTSAIQQFAGFPFAFLPAFVAQQEVLNRTDIIVADFCLPYRCCSDTPAVSYLLAKPRPIVLLTKSAFCEDDDTRYEFILDPAGGILKGEGTFPEDDTYYFQPSLVEDISADRTVTFTYAVEGSYDTFTVAIYPEPNGSLNIKENTQFCNDAAPVEFVLSANDPAVELVVVTVGETPRERFDPSQYAQNGEREDVTLVVLLRDRRTNCTNTLEIPVTVFPLPNAGFRFEPPSETGGYCAEGGEQGGFVSFVPEDSDVSDRFTVDGEEVEGDRIFLGNFSRIDNPVNLQVVHFARNEPGCTAQSAQTLRIFPIPRAIITVEPTNICSAADPVDIRITSASGDNVLGENDTLRAFAPDGNEIGGAINLAALQFEPSSVLSRMADNQNRMRVRIRYEVIGEGGCPNDDSDQITVHRTPNPDFEIGIENVNSDGVTVGVRVTHLPGNVEEFNLRWETNGGDRSSNDTNFTVFYTPNELREREAIVITLTVIYRGRNFVCTSPAVERSIPVPPLNPDDDGGDGPRRNPNGGNPTNPDGPVIVNPRLQGGGGVVSDLDREDPL